MLQSVCLLKQLEQLKVCVSDQKSLLGIPATTPAVTIGRKSKTTATHVLKPMESSYFPSTVVKVMKETAKVAKKQQRSLAIC